MEFGFYRPIAVNAAGDAGDASPETFGKPGTKCLIGYPPMFVKIVIKLPGELMHTVKPAFEVQARHRDSPRESDRLVLTSSTTQI